MTGDDMERLFSDGPDLVGTAEERQAREEATNWFVQIPYPGSLKTFARAGDAVGAVLIEIAHEAWYKKKRTITVRTEPLRQAGLSHDAKGRALRRLERARLIEIVSRGRPRNPIVRVKFKLYKSA